MKDTKSKPIKTYPTISACGLDCGLCPRYYTAGPSRCPGCCGPDFFNKHPTCSTITCCVKNKNLEVCGECSEFPCPKFKKPEEYQKLETSSYPPYRKMVPNLNFIKKHGIKSFITEQKKRIRLLEKMIKDFDDGRSRSFYCRAAALLDIPSLENSINDAKQRISSGDIKIRAKFLREVLNQSALKQGIELFMKVSKITQKNMKAKM